MYNIGHEYDLDEYIWVYEYEYMHMTGLLHECIFHVGGVLKPAIFGGLPKALWCATGLRFNMLETLTHIVNWS